MGVFNLLARHHRNNVETLRSSPLAEVSGALGDLGTLLPLMIALAVSGSISLSTTLVFSGFFNMITGVVFGVPLPVQPMKAIAAAAIASNSSLEETEAAGSLVAVVLLVLSLTGLVQYATDHIPVPVIKGIQVAAGLTLAGSGGLMVKQLPWISQALDNRLWALGAFILLLATQSFRRFPYALIVFILGIAFAVILNWNHGYDFRIWVPSFSLPIYTPAAVSMAVAQLPLTLLNSVIAVSALSVDLLPGTPAPGVTSLALSVSAMNVVGCWFGAMPVCHGSGGLAAQVRFGARSGASIFLLGILKLVTGLLFGDRIMGLLDRFPSAFLGVMVLAAGLELASAGESLNFQDKGIKSGERKKRWMVMVMTVAITLGVKNAGAGFVAGMCCHWSYMVADWIVAKWRGSEGVPLLGGP